MLAPMVETRRAVESMVRYLTQRPEEITRFIRSGLGMRLGVPLAAFRWLLAELTDEAGLDAELTVEPPGIGWAATLERMRTRLRLSGTLLVEDIQIDEGRMELTLGIEGFQIDVLSDEKTQLSALLKSGALDLSRPGDLIAELPDLPPVVVGGEGTRIMLDLMRAPRLDNARVRELVGVLSSLVTVNDIQTDESDHLDVRFQTLPHGARTATRAIRGAILEPGLVRARALAKRWLLRRGSLARRLLDGGR